jgi:hypothetical protein
MLPDGAQNQVPPPIPPARGSFIPFILFYFIYLSAVFDACGVVGRDTQEWDWTVFFLNREVHYAVRPPPFARQLVRCDALTHARTRRTELRPRTWTRGK